MFFVFLIFILHKCITGFCSYFNKERQTNTYTNKNANRWQILLFTTHIVGNISLHYVCTLLHLIFRSNVLRSEPSHFPHLLLNSSILWWTSHSYSSAIISLYNNNNIIIILSFDIAPFPYKHAQRRITFHCQRIDVDIHIVN